MEDYNIPFHSALDYSENPLLRPYAKELFDIRGSAPHLWFLAVIYLVIMLVLGGTPHS